MLVDSLSGKGNSGPHAGKGGCFLAEMWNIAHGRATWGRPMVAWRPRIKLLVGRVLNQAAERTRNMRKWEKRRDRGRMRADGEDRIRDDGNRKEK